MRILFISNLYPPHDLGGMEQLCQEIVERMQTRGHVCHVLTSRFGVNGHSQNEENVTRALYMETDIYHYRPLDFFLHRPWQRRVNRRSLRNALDVFQPDVIFIWGMWNLSPQLACWAEEWMPGKVAYNIESYWPIDADPHTAYWSKAGRSLAGRMLLWPVSRLAMNILKMEQYPPRPKFHHVSCCSEHLVNVFTEAGIIPAGAVAILNGIDPEPFIDNQRAEHNSNSLLRLLYFGGLMEHKGVHTAIEAIGLLQQRHLADRLHLTIVGGGEPGYENYLHTLTASLDLEDKVHFMGRVPRSKIPQILPNYDIFLFTSIWAEPFGRTIIEAMAAGLAVIGSDVGGSREIFEFYPEETLFPPGDAEALSCQIQRFLSDPEMIQRLGQAGQSLVLRRFTLERMTDEIETWLKSLL